MKIRAVKSQHLQTGLVKAEFNMAIRLCEYLLRAKVWRREVG